MTNNQLAIAQEMYEELKQAVDALADKGVKSKDLSHLLHSWEISLKQADVEDDFPELLKEQIG